MDKHEIQRELGKYSYICHLIDEQKSEIAKVKAKIQELTDTCLKANAIDGLPHEKNLNDRVYQTVQKIVDIYEADIKAIEATIERLKEKKEAVDNIFKKLDELCASGKLQEQHYIVMHLKYAKGWSWHSVAAYFPYSIRHCITFRNEALEALCE